MVGDQLKGITAKLRYDSTERMYTAINPNVDYIEWTPNAFGTIFIGLNGDDRSPNRRLTLNIGQDFFIEVMERVVGEMANARNAIAEDVRKNIRSVNDESGTDDSAKCADLGKTLDASHWERKAHTAHKEAMRTALKKMLEVLE